MEDKGRLPDFSHGTRWSDLSAEEMRRFVKAVEYWRNLSARYPLQLEQGSFGPILKSAKQIPSLPVPPFVLSQARITGYDTTAKVNFTGRRIDAAGNDIDASDIVIKTWKYPNPNDALDMVLPYIIPSTQTPPQDESIVPVIQVPDTTSQNGTTWYAFQMFVSTCAPL